MVDIFIKFGILGIFPAVMAFAAASDLVSMTIANRLQLILVVSFFALAFACGFSWEAIGMHVLAFALLLAAAFFCFAYGWIGGGDAKLVACTALWFGFNTHLYMYLLLAALLGGGLTLAILYLRGITLPACLAGQGWLCRLHDEKQGIPYGIALAAAALLTYSETPIFAFALAR